MKRLNGDARFQSEFLSKPIDDGVIKCRCGWNGERNELVHDEDIEWFHPSNRKNPKCTMQHPENCHKTKFEKCPRCGRCKFADGRPTGV